MKTTPRTPILVILGPTASGKTDLAVAAADRTGGEILSLDSMQVYRGMDIGTAKPGAATLSRIRHHGVDVADPGAAYTVAKFVELADAAIADAARRSVPLIATGGTPLYYMAVFEGLFEGPGEDPGIRQRLAGLSPDTLHARLSAIDPAAASRIHANDTRRLVRAIEVFELTGKPISSLQQQWQGGNRRHEATWIGLTWEKQSLNRRINSRVGNMISAGWVDEVRGLMSLPGGLSLTAGLATGYRELIEHLSGRMSLDEAAERIKIATRQLARRQIKWFRRFPGVTWIPGAQPAEELLEACSKIWAQGDASNHQASDAAIGPLAATQPKRSTPPGSADDLQ